MLNEAQIRAIIKAQGCMPYFPRKQRFSASASVSEVVQIKAGRGKTRRYLGTLEEISQLSEAELIQHIVARFATPGGRHHG